MYISKKKYNALVNKVDETKARQEKLEQLIDEKLLCMTKKSSESQRNSLRN